MESNVFCKSSHSEKVALQKKQAMRNTAFLKNKLFPKSHSSEEIDGARNQLLQVKKQLFCKYLYSKQFLYQKGRCSKKELPYIIFIDLKSCIHPKQKISQFLLFTVKISYQGLVSALDSIGPPQGSPQGLKGAQGASLQGAQQ